VAGELTPLQRFRLDGRQLGELLLLVGAIAIVVLRLPNQIWSAANSMFVMSVGAIAFWRYGWWTTHLVRSRIYSFFVFPEIRRRAEELWAQEWRPRFLHILMITFKERRETTERVLDAIVRECLTSGIPARLIVGTGDPSDEQVIEDYFGALAPNPQLDVVIVRQNQPGKRFAIGLALRAMSRYGVEKDDLAIFMDGDTILEEGLVRKCAPLFPLFPKLGAVTTNETAIVAGPRWIQNWYDMRFAQRRWAMESHSLSRKVLTLTGRLSVYRAENVVNESFIRTVEADHLTHWLWGRFRFLSGDDKSTWYWLLKDGQDMLYVPDAHCLTAENVLVNPYERLLQNLLRWSGNTLRNGARALALGPWQVGPFIWWCLLDQRLSMWTMLIGPTASLLLALSLGPAVLVAYLVWVLSTRLLQSCVIFYYARRIDVSFPFLLYANQLATSMVKVHLLFRISKQRWLNRGDQRPSRSDLSVHRLQALMANFLTLLYVSLLVLLIGVYSCAFDLPRWPSSFHWLWPK